MLEMQSKQSTLKLKNIMKNMLTLFLKKFLKNQKFVKHADCFLQL